MTVECAACQTENRDGAKFCKGCGRRLAVITAATASDGWPETQRMPLQAVSDPTNLSDEEASSIGPASASTPLTTVQRQPRRISEKKKKKRLILLSFCSLVVIAAAIGAATWRANEQGQASPGIAAGQAPASALVATAPSIAPAPAAPATPRATPSGPVERGPVVIEPSAEPSLPPSPPATVAKPDPGPAPQADPTPPSRQAALPMAQPLIPTPTPTPTPAPVQKQKKAEKQDKPKAQAEVAARQPRKPQTASSALPSTAAATQAIPVAPAVAVPVVTAELPALPSPSALCAGQGFFARGRCMVAQCAKAEYRTHAQCDAVRRQEQIEEEKRNPTQLN